MTEFTDLEIVFETDSPLEQQMITDAFNLYANSSFSPDTATFNGGTHVNATKIIFYTDSAAFGAATGNANFNRDGLTSGNIGGAVAIWFNPAIFLDSARANDTILHELVHVAVQAADEVSAIHSVDFYLKLSEVVISLDVEVSGWSTFDLTKTWVYTDPGSGKIYKGGQLEIAIAMALDGSGVPMSAADWEKLSTLVDAEALLIMAERYERFYPDESGSAFRAADVAPSA